MSSGHSIILIDPEEQTRDVLIERLRMQGYKTTGFAASVEGANAALSSPPSAVIADSVDDSISGVQLTRLLRAEPSTERVPVILRGPDSPQTASGPNERCRRLRRQGRMGIWCGPSAVLWLRWPPRKMGSSPAANAESAILIASRLRWMRRF